MPELAPKVVVDVISRAFADETHYAMDDLASKLIAKIWLKKIEFNDEAHLRRWVWRCIRNELIDRGYRLKKQRNFSELIGEGENENEVGWIESLIAPVEAKQMDSMEVKRIKKIARQMPLIHRSIVTILADGGSILDAHRELGITPLDALRYLGEVRDFIMTGNSPRQLDRAA